MTLLIAYFAVGFAIAAFTAWRVLVLKRAAYLHPSLFDWFKVASIPILWPLVLVLFAVFCYNER